MKKLFVFFILLISALIGNQCFGNFTSNTTPPTPPATSSAEMTSYDQMNNDKMKTTNLPEAEKPETDFDEEMNEETEETQAIQ